MEKGGTPGLRPTLVYLRSLPGLPSSVSLMT